jgi:signal transduction histidine kinase
MRSLEKHLLVWTSGALCVGALLLAAVAYAVVLDEMDEVFDENLRQVALAIAEHAPRDDASAGQLHLPKLPHGYEEADDFDLAIAAFDRQGRLVHSSGPSARLPFIRNTGISEVALAGQPWHVYTVVLPGQVVEVAERASSHRHLATRTAAELPVVALLLVLALRRGLRPLDRAAAGVAARSGQSLAPIAAGDVPREIHPLIGAINELMGRLSDTMDAQRRFIADAAHELRTPMTALRLQMQVLAEATEAGERASNPAAAAPHSNRWISASARARQWNDTATLRLERTWPCRSRTSATRT